MPPSRIELAPGVHAPADALRFQFSRSSGPGGQNVNKVNTKAELWLPINSITGITERARARLADMAAHRLTIAGEIHLTSDATRSQESNRSQILELLRELIVHAQHEPKKRKRTKPSKAAKRRRLESKRHRSEIKSHRRRTSDD
jgi:ribosome-associated protein